MEIRISSSSLSIVPSISTWALGMSLCRVFRGRPLCGKSLVSPSDGNYDNNETNDGQDVTGTLNVRLNV